MQQLYRALCPVPRSRTGTTSQEPGLPRKSRDYRWNRDYAPW
ncbi:MAG: hypothetical protein NTW99_08445 [Chloroflexi bacterium]|nr:hypothetical protein [Chloroflexota bacterium]